MKSHLLALQSLFLGFAVSHAAIFDSGLINVGALIPDGDPNGYQSSQTLNGFSGTISDVNIRLNISGGFNGDLYGYLFHNGTSAILLNRVGRGASSALGYSDTGFGPLASTQFSLDDQAVRDVHLYRTFPFTLNGSGQLTGSWQPDGRLLDPLSAAGSFDGAARTGMLSLFNGMDPNGTWSLFLADVSAGAQSTLVSWDIEIATVPEPSVLTLLGLGVIMLLRSLRLKWLRLDAPAGP